MNCLNTALKENGCMYVCLFKPFVKYNCMHVHHGGCAAYKLILNAFAYVHVIVHNQGKRLKVVRLAELKLRV